MFQSQFIPITDSDKKEMLQTIGVSSFNELIKNLPQEHLYPDIDLPRPLSEPELVSHISALAKKNKPTLSFLGAGASEHFIPATVDYIASRGDFLTAYTPYQAEASQGTLQTTYEFQTMICELFKMDVSNASLYDGASSLAEAAMMSLKHTQRNKIIAPSNIHPHYQTVLKTYTGKNVILPLPCPDGIADLKSAAGLIDENVAAIIIQTPNFFGCLEDTAPLVELAHTAGSLVIAVVNPISLGIISPPGEYQADIAVAEGQPLGMPLSYGGPYLGLFTCKEELMRKMPGRVVGLTSDSNGKRGFVLTLQTREQHIRRDKATSNICTNQALCALRAGVYLSLMGPEGMREIATQNMAKAHYASRAITALKGFELAFSAPFFNEFVIRCPISPEKIVKKLSKNGITPGLPLGRYFRQFKDCLLICVTETKTKADIDKLAEALGKAGTEAQRHKADNDTAVIASVAKQSHTL